MLLFEKQLLLSRHRPRSGLKRTLSKKKGSLLFQKHTLFETKGYPFVPFSLPVPAGHRVSLPQHCPIQSYRILYSCSLSYFSIFGRMWLNLVATNKEKAMLNHANTLVDSRSRIGYLPRTAFDKAEKNSRRTTSVFRRWHVWLGIAIGAVGFMWAGAVLSYADPSAGWLDTGTLSLPLFAAWSCVLGYGIMGLLPVMLGRISKKGGIKPWKPVAQTAGMLIVYIGYIALLCVLL